MKRRLAVLASVGVLSVTSSCDDFLDINTNPNGPETVGANLYLAPMLHWLVQGQHWDGRCTALYTQQLTATTRSTYDMMGPNRNTDTCGQQWRDVYWSFGQNLIDMMDISGREQRWDLLGVGYVLKAWGWLQLTSIHGEIIVEEAFDQTTFSFDYDDQAFVYQEVLELLDSAIVNLNRTDGAVDAGYLGRGDNIYGGDRTKWLKFAHGLHALALNHFSNKPSYDPEAVIAHVDAAFTSNADDALLRFNNTSTTDRNTLGPAEADYGGYRQTEFVVALMDGTVFGVEDPRMRRMLAPAPDGTYRGLDPDLSTPYTSLPEAQRPMTPFGYVATPAGGSPGIYLFSDDVRVPVMTYAQLQFVKAEAAYHMGDFALALEAYEEGISAHIDFVNDRNREDDQQATQITAAEKTAFLANAAIVPTDPSALTLSMIMTQKYIAQWVWSPNEVWMDMKRYRYTDTDPVTGDPIYPGFELPLLLHSSNQGKPVFRLLPRYNSEYVWNQAGLDKIGGLDEDYHTDTLWVVKPTVTP